MNASRVLWLVLVFLASVRVVPVEAQGTSKQSKSSLKSFFVVTEAVSDASPFWFKYILDLSPSVEGTSAQWIRVAPFGNACPGVTVKAMAATVPKDISNIVKTDLCALSVSAVEKALSAAKVNSSIWDTASFGIVAKCGDETKVFHMPLKDLVDLNRLKRTSAKAYALYGTYYQIVSEVFPRKSFYKNSAEVDRELQVAGSAFVSELLSGKYDNGLSRGYLSGDSLKTFLKDYRGIRHDADWIQGSVQLDDPVSGNLTQYVEPIYPPLAIQARIAGAVQIDLDVGELGEVKNVVTAGHPLLIESAKVAANQWKFKPSQLTGHVHAVLRYSLDGKCE